MKEMFKIFLEDFIFYLVSKTRPYKILYSQYSSLCMKHRILSEEYYEILKERKK